jgi:hypothetical protein
VAENPLKLLAAWPELDAEVILPRSGTWPSLNNSIDRDRGYADELRLEDGAGVTLDYVRYRPGGLDGHGVSLERWIEAGRLIDPHLLVPCSSAGGATPGEGGWLAEGGGQGSLWLKPQPDPFCPEDGDEQFCRIAVPAPLDAGARVTADVFSMAGRRVATLMVAAEAAGPLLLVWDGRSGRGERLPTGLYLFRIILEGGASRTRGQFIRSLTLVRS